MTAAASYSNKLKSKILKGFVFQFFSTFYIIAFSYLEKQLIVFKGVMKKSVKRTSTGVDGRRPSTRTSTSRKAQSGRRRPSTVDVDRQRSKFIK